MMKTNANRPSLGLSLELVGMSLAGIGLALLLGAATDALGVTDFAVGAPIIGLLG